ncbi:hypothetical protein [Salana multivorans]
MTTPADQNDALLDLCRAFLQDPKIVSQPDWRKLVLIGEVTDASTAIFGYSYDAAGEGVLTAPSNGVSSDKLEALQEAMRQASPTGRGWLACMVRISSEGEVGADFEYDDLDRWSHTPDNYRQRLAEYADLPV